jgi:hypothetical protein
MRVLICGSRHWTDTDAVVQEVAMLVPGTVVIHGDAPGADRIAGATAEARGLQVVRFPADWERHGRAAGPIRNRQMLREGKPDLVLAFTADLERSQGTRDMVRQAQRAGVPVRLITGTTAPDGPPL